MLDILNQIDSFVWGPPLLMLLVGTGIWLTVTFAEAAACLASPQSSVLSLASEYTVSIAVLLAENHIARLYQTPDIPQRLTNFP